MFDADHDHAVGAEMSVDEIEQVRDGPEGQAGFREKQEMQFAQAAFGRADQSEDGEDLLPFVFWVGQPVGMLVQAELVGDLADHAVEMMPQGKFEMYFFLDDPEHGGSLAK